MSLKPELFDNINTILNLEKYNGRVNIIEPPSPNIRFQMQKKIAIKTANFR
jgi:hypothetical protein